ncbi:hypothetical protein BRC88_07260 [Halobacteriales archaeon QS_4_69_225]|nr:MAG: hypothetical protein BRC88_07260 [Halobacteriales archaeon QS_4_69_225]
MTEETPRVAEFPDVSRRRFLAGAGGTLAGGAAARAADNALLGYGELGYGTNLLEQDLAGLVADSLRMWYDERVAGRRLRVIDGDVVVSTADGGRRLALRADAEATAADLDADLGLGGRLEALYADASDLVAGEYELTFGRPAAFFERVAGADPRPEAVTAMRGRTDRRVDPDVVERFAGVSPRRPAATVDGLVDAFREHASYDIPRYLAGSVEDNVLLGAVDLRAPFEERTDLEGLLTDDDAGLFCYELTVRSMEALQAVAPHVQRAPVAAAYVRDARHKHVYTGVASAIREDGDLVVPMTFVDYTHSTVYDDLGVASVAGRGLAAYDDRHRATHVQW